MFTSTGEAKMVGSRLCVTNVTDVSFARPEGFEPPTF
jgi:hypothetical protein